MKNKENKINESLNELLKCIEEKKDNTINGIIEREKVLNEAYKKDKWGKNEIQNFEKHLKEISIQTGLKRNEILLIINLRKLQISKFYTKQNTLQEDIQRMKIRAFGIHFKENDKGETEE